MNKLITILFISVFLNILSWIYIIPLWHFPDEQAHFGQVAYMAETGKKPDGSAELDLTDEIYTSEMLLGTNRDKMGNNKFTFHPEYRIPFSLSTIGIYEARIAEMTKTDAKREFVAKEVARYPVMYYLPGVLLYRIFYTADLFTRVYVVRFWSLILFFLNIYFVYLIAKLLFDKNKLVQLTLTIMVAFQPMMVFANSGVNSDALGNLLFTIFLYLCARIIVRGLNAVNLVSIALTVMACVYTKPQFILTIPLILFLAVVMIVRDTKEKFKIPFLIISIALSTIALFLVNYFRIGPVSVFHLFLSRLDINSLFKFTWEYSLSHTYSEVLPWYWGIYDWLGVTYPRIIHRMINWTILLSIIGLVKFIILAVRNRKTKSRNFQAGIFLVFVSTVYFIAICFYDWLSWYTQGYQLGVQGRYFFPVIIVHMLLILIGWRELFPDIKGLKEKGMKILGIMMIALNIYALYTVAKTYYDLWPIDVFFRQVSQYKPWFVKGWGFIIVSVAFFSTLAVFLIEYMKYPNDQKKSSHQ